MKNTIHRHVRAVALVVLAFLFAAIVGYHASAAPVPAGKIERGPIAKPVTLVFGVVSAPGKVEDGPLAKPAAAAILAAPLAVEAGKVQRGPIGK